MAGILDGNVGYPRLTDVVCGIPHALRLACDLAHAGMTRIHVVWNGNGPPPDLSAIAADPRLAGRATLAVVSAPPRGDDADPIVVVRADRLFHRDMPSLVQRVQRSAGHAIAKIRGAEHDAVYATDRATAARLADAAYYAAGIAKELLASPVDELDPPYAGFTARANTRLARARAERQLVHSLRKSADGLAARAINRRISLPISRALASTSVTPNQVTLFALWLALVGGGVIATGGYAAGVIGMLLVELGSIIDGVDGELARLRFQFSRLGQWLDTVVDDVANVAYASGVMLNLHLSGVGWALPLGAVALACFAITQATQYALIGRVYKSGDLAAIPWAFQSSDVLSKTGPRALLPKLFKRDFVITMFCALAIVGLLELVLLAFAAGAFTFFVVFFVQLLRYRRTLAA